MRTLGLNNRNYLIRKWNIFDIVVPILVVVRIVHFFSKIESAKQDFVSVSNEGLGSKWIRNGLLAGEEDGSLLQLGGDKTVNSMRFATDRTTRNVWAQSTRNV